MDELQVGDIVTTYHKGYWRVTKITRRFLTQGDFDHQIQGYQKAGDEKSPLIEYELVADSDGNRPKGKPRTNRCDAGYCARLTREWIEEQKKSDIAKWDKISNILPD